MWRKQNPFALLVGMQIGAATLENSMEYLITFKMELHLELLLEPTDSTSGNLSKKKPPETLIRKNISTPLFIAALFTITKIRKQPKCP